MPRTVPRVGPRGHRYKLTLNYPVPHASISCVPEPSGLEYAAGTQVMITAIPAEGWEFWRWRDALTDSVNPGMVVMQEHRNLVAQFREIAE